MFTKEEKLIRNTFAYELIRNHVFYVVYPKEAGMTVEEFVNENRLLLRDLTVAINKEYNWKINSRHKGVIETSIRVLFESLGISEYASGGGKDYGRRSTIIEEYKQTNEYRRKLPGFK